MRTRRLGQSDLDITVVGFGAWAIGGGDWIFGWGPQDDADSVTAIRRAVDLGINWVDTAAVYGLGRSEEVVARALKELPESRRPYVFTKSSLVWNDRREVSHSLRADSIRQEVEGSLSRLGVDAIDLTPRGPRREVPAMEVVIGVCHGGWDPSDGFVRIPDGVNLFLFQEPGVPMDASVADYGASSTSQRLQELQSSAMLPLTGGDVVPDYRTSALSQEDVVYFESNPDPEVAVVPADGQYLSEILAQTQGNVYWFACQSFISDPDPDAYKQAVEQGQVKLAG